MKNKKRFGLNRNQFPEQIVEPQIEEVVVTEEEEKKNNCVD